MKNHCIPERGFSLRFRALASAALLALPLSLTAQQLEDNTTDAEDVVELSPFTVDASQDTGYQATSTLAGSRIKADLKDIAASISVVTKDFMEDIGSNDASTLLNYIAGTEVGGPQGNFMNVGGFSGGFPDTDGLTRSPNVTNRVRGLAGADQTRDFFLSGIPWDSYNVDRVDINRGSNSFLYGLGSAAGIINTNTINANLNDRRTNLEFRSGRFGTTAVILDHNQPIIDGKLAVRFAAKSGNEQFKQKEAFIDDDRFFAVVEAQPFANTRLVLKFEDGTIDSNKPDLRPPLDQISHWMAMGQPILDHPSNSIRNQAPVQNGHINASLPGNRWLFNTQWVGGPLVYFSDNPLTWDASLWGTTGAGAWYAENWHNNGGGTYTGGTQAYMRGVPEHGWYLRQIKQGTLGANNWITPTMNDPEIFDFYNNLLVGDNKWEAQRFNTINVTLEQRIPVIDAMLQAAYDRQDHDWSFINTWNFNAIAFWPDVNSHLLDGRPNPNVNRPFMSSAGWASAQQDERETVRLSAYKSFDFEDMRSGFLGRMLGKHTITLNYQEYSRQQRNQGGRPHVADPGFHAANPTNANAGNAEVRKRITGGQRALSFYSYVGGAIAPGGSLAAANITAPQFSFLDQETIPISFYHQPRRAWESYNSQVLRGRISDMSEIHSDWAWQLTREEIDSSSVVLQSTILDDAVVGTLGWREDEFSSYRAPAAQQDGFVYTTPPLGDVPDLVQKESSFAYGIVARLPRVWRDKTPFKLDLSVFYNSSDNFSPTPPRMDILGNQISPPTGETEDYGFMVSTLDGKFSLRTTFYETAARGSSIDNRDANNSIVRGLENAIVATSQGWNDTNPALGGFLTWLKSEDSAYLRNVFDFNVTYGADGMPINVSKNEKHGVVFDTKDSVSKGYEIELVYNLLDNWRMAINFSNQDAVTANSSRASLELLPQLRSDFNGGPGQIWLDNAGARPLRQELIPFENAILRQVALDGFSNTEIRSNRLNFITNYSFRSGRLNGFSVGGAVRWQDEIIIGQGYRLDPVLGQLPDLDNVYRGPAETNYDAWIGYSRKLSEKLRWEIQLNVRNIGVGNELIPVGAQPDGSLAVTRIAPPMTWTLKNSFSF